MFDELEKYSNFDHFFFKSYESLSEICNAPKDGAGVYVIYSLVSGQANLIYIGSSGQMQSNGKLKIRKGGLWDRIVNGKQFEQPRRISWPIQIKKEKIESLDIYWYETFNNNVKDIPLFVEGVLIQKFYEMFGVLPKWNKSY